MPWLTDRWWGLSLNRFNLALGEAVANPKYQKVIRHVVCL